MKHLPLLLLFAALLATACSSSSGGEGADTAASDGRVAGTDTAPASDGAGGSDAVPGADATGDTGPRTDGGGGGDVVARPLTPVEWCTLWPESFCALLSRCPLPGQEDRDEAACRAAVGAGCPGAAVANAVAAGELAYDPAAAADCLTATADLDCATLYERLRTSPDTPAAACRAALAGQVAAGGACRIGNECEPGALCSFGAACPGACEAFAAVGDPCGVGAWCDFERAACVGGECVALPEEAGVACVGAMCRAPLVCDPEGDTCRTPSLAGERCGAGAGTCYPGLLCFGDEGGGGECAPVHRDGEPCFANGDCRGAADEVLVCAGGTCQTAPGVEEPCFDFLCAVDAWCETTGVTPTCRAFPPAGQPCAPGNRCGPARFCDAGTCRDRRAAGAACATPAECATGRCFGALCRAPDEPPCPSL